MRAEIITVTRADKCRTWLAAEPRTGQEIADFCGVTRAMLATILLELRESGLNVVAIGSARKSARGPLSKLYQIKEAKL